MHTTPGMPAIRKAPLSMSFLVKSWQLTAPSSKHELHKPSCSSECVNTACLLWPEHWHVFLNLWLAVKNETKQFLLSLDFRVLWWLSLREKVVNGQTMESAPSSSQWREEEPPFFSLWRCICTNSLIFWLPPPICTVCMGVGPFPSFQPAYSPQRAALRVVCSRDIFSPLLFAPRLVLSALPSLYTPLWGRHCIFSVNWDEVKLSSFCFWTNEDIPEICHQPPWKKGNLSYLLLVV